MSQEAQMDIEYLARLARLELTPDEKAKFERQLGEVLDYFEKIRAVDVEGVEPTAHASPVFNVWEEDVPREPFTPAEAMRNAPKQRQSQIVVPKVVEDA